MSEEEERWYESMRIRQLLELINNKTTRKTTLFCVACCRIITQLAKDIKSKEAVDLAELWADGKILAAECKQGTFNYVCGYADTTSNTITKSKHAGYLRDIYHNPFKPMPILDPRWLTANVCDLAESIYENNGFHLIGILGDALMDAGCDDEQIMQHCYNGMEHVKGCWVVDLILGKE